MGIFTDQAYRLLRDDWQDANMLAQELYAMFVSDDPLQVNSPIVITNNTASPTITMNSFGPSDLAIQVLRQAGQGSTYGGVAVGAVQIGGAVDAGSIAPGTGPLFGSLPAGDALGLQLGALYTGGTPETGNIQFGGTPSFGSLPLGGGPTYGSTEFGNIDIGGIAIAAPPSIGPMTPGQYGTPVPNGQIVILQWPSPEDLLPQSSGGPTSGGGGGIPGQIVSGSGQVYLVNLYQNGLTGGVTTETAVVQLQIDPDDAIPAGTWVVVFLGEDGVYFMQVPVWM